jgi:hypothetical protein
VTRLVPKSGRAWFLLLLGLADIVVVTYVLTSGNSPSGSTAPTVPLQRFGTTIAAVPWNRVTGSGTAMVQLQGSTARVTVTTSGLLSGSPHLMHIHGRALGTCPAASAAGLHNGHRSISTGDGIHYYGPALTSLTEYGSTSGDVPTNVNMNLYSAAGAIRYVRTIALAPQVADLIRGGDAVIVVHGIDYNDNHVYDFGALGVSDLDKALPGEATAPALCGPLRATAPGQTTAAAARAHHSQTTTYVAALRSQSAPPLDAAQQQLSLLCHLGLSDAGRRTDSGVRRT